MRDRFRKRREKALEPAEILADAEAAAKEDGLRFTPIRRHVLQTLVDAGAPMKAYDLLRSLEGIGSDSPPTVYRALDFLTDLGAVRRVDSLNAFVALRFGATREEIAFAVCETCGRVSELAARPAFDALYEAAEDAGFKGLSASLEVRVQCANCPANAN
ncbi:MAG: Fur family transcriptional regulator [Pseudomonadota bacterium]